MTEQYKTELSDVIYNAAEQAFEALVTVRDGASATRYACSLEAPITMSWEEAAAGLSQQAVRRHGSGFGLRSSLSIVPAPKRKSRLKPAMRRGLPLGEFGFFRGRAA